MGGGRARRGGARMGRRRRSCRGGAACAGGFTAAAAALTAFAMLLAPIALAMAAGPAPSTIEEPTSSRPAEVCPGYKRRACKKNNLCYWRKGPRSTRGCLAALDVCESANQGNRGRKRSACTQASPMCRCQNASGRCGRCESDPAIEFAEWKTRYGKVYASDAAEAAAYANWLANRAKVRESRLDPEAFLMQLNDAADQSAEDFLNSPRLGGRSPEGCAGNDLSEPAIGRRLSKVVSSPSLKDAPTPLVACPQPHGEDSCDWSFDDPDDDRGAFLPPVKNQGQCGSCYAFSSVAALEAALAIVEHKNSGKHTPVSLSEQMVITTPWAATGPSADSPQGPPPGGASVETSSPCPSAVSLGALQSKKEGWPAQPCAGGNIADVFDWMVAAGSARAPTGVCTTADFAYAGYTESAQRPPSTCACAFECGAAGGGCASPVCRPTPPSRALTTKPATVWGAGLGHSHKLAYVRMVNAALKAQPVAAGIYATNIVQYSGGIITSKFCKAETGQHGVTIVGFGTCHKRKNRRSEDDLQCANAPAGTHYWKVRNSWGPNWGLGGYFYVQQGACGLPAHVSGVPDLTGVQAGAST